MKVVKNDCLQSITVYFSTEKGCKERFMQPGESLVVPEALVYTPLRKIFQNMPRQSIPPSLVLLGLLVKALRTRLL